MLAFTAALTALVATSFVSAEATELQLQAEEVGLDVSPACFPLGRSADLGYCFLIVLNALAGQLRP
jgi:hypothetical protein